MYLYTVDSKMYKIVRTLWTNKYADPDWSAINLYPEIPESPIFDNEIVYVWGKENLDYLKEKGYNCIEMDDNEYPYFNKEFTQHGKKLIALDKALKEFGEVILLDWDCVPVKDLNQDIIRFKETSVPVYCYTEKLLKKLKENKLKKELEKYHWKVDDMFITPNFGCVYTRDKKLGEKLLIESIKNNIEYCVEEHAMFSFANCSLDKFIEKYHPGFCYGRSNNKINNYIDTKIFIDEYFKHL